VIDWFLNPKKDIPPALHDLIECREKWVGWIAHVWRNSGIIEIGGAKFLRYSGTMADSPETEYLISFFCSEFERILNRGYRG